ncbi:hypothetical protein ACX80H_03910 [Arthrobacter sp. MDT2-2]
MMSGYKAVPEPLWQKIEKFNHSFQIGVSKTYSRESLDEGKLASLGIADFASAMNIDAVIVPDVDAGRWSAWNVEGREVLRPDLPKVSRSSVSWVYPYGNKSASQVPAYRTRLVTPRETLHGHGYSIAVMGSAAQDEARLAFRVQRVFGPGTSKDDPDLLMSLSLLRENVGSADVIPADMDIKDWIHHQEISWTLLPPGQRGNPIFSEIVKRLDLDPNSARTQTAKQRNEAIWSLSPQAVAVGNGNFSRYVAYIFRDDLVVLENLTYGNALYVMYENWQALSQRSRLDLLADPAADYTRIVHAGRWISQLRKVVQASRKRKS